MTFEQMTLKELVKTRQEIFLQIQQRKKEYLEQHAKESTLSAEEARQIACSGRTCHCLSFANLCKVSLMIATVRQQDLAQGEARFWPVLVCNEAEKDEEYRMLFGAGNILT